MTVNPNRMCTGAITEMNNSIIIECLCVLFREFRNFCLYIYQFWSIIQYKLFINSNRDFVIALSFTVCIQATRLNSVRALVSISEKAPAIRTFHKATAPR